MGGVVSIGSHPLAGRMEICSPWQIRQGLQIRPPTAAQLDELAAEELSGKDRPDVYRIFAVIAQDIRR